MLKLPNVTKLHEAKHLFNYFVLYRIKFNLYTKKTIYQSFYLYNIEEKTCFQEALRQAGVYAS